MWFVHSSYIDGILKADQALLGIDEAKIKDSISAIRGAPHADATEGPDIYSVVGEFAVITISGVLTKYYSWIYGYMGMGSTAYTDIEQAIALGEADDNVKEHKIYVSSGGGRIDGLTIATKAIREAKKPVTAIVDGMAASAAYAIVAEADKVYATLPTDRFGSVGIVVGQYISPDFIEITNRKSPDKRPDASTEEGKAVIQDELDSIHNLMIGDIAQGRSAASGQIVTPEIVNNTYGGGRVFIAKEAIEKGMIDGMLESQPNSVQNSNSSSKVNGLKAEKQESKKVIDMSDKVEMTAAILAADYPSVFEAIVSAERDRCVAHLIGGQSSGLMDSAIEAIENGTEVTQAQQMKYNMAAANRVQAKDRAGDNPNGGKQAKNKDKDLDAGNNAKGGLASLDDLDDEVAAALSSGASLDNVDCDIEIE